MPTGRPRCWCTSHAGGELRAVVAFGAGVACELMSASVAPDDIVSRPREIVQGARPPLLVLEPLERFIDEHGLGQGAIRATPIGEGHSNVTYLIERDSGPE